MGVAGLKGKSAQTGLPAAQTQKNDIAPTGSRQPLNPNMDAKGAGRVGTAGEQKAASMMMTPAQIQKLDANILMMNKFINQTYLEALDSCPVTEFDDSDAHRDWIKGFEITRLMLGQRENNHEKLVSLYAAIRRMEPHSVALVLDAQDGVTRIYLCVKSSSTETAYEALKRNFLGQFPGSEVLEDKKKKDNTKVPAVLARLGNCPSTGKYIHTLSVSPSRRDAEQKDNSLFASAQGMEKFIDAMTGSQYTVMILATPVKDNVMEMRKQGMEAMYTMLSPYSKENVSYGENESDATNFSMSTNMSKSISETISESYGTSYTRSDSSSRGGSSGSNAYGFSSGSNWGSSTSTSTGTSTNRGTSKGTSVNKGEGESEGTSRTRGRSRTINMTREIKSVQNCMKRLDAEISRIEESGSLGMWNVCCYITANDAATAHMAAGSLQALWAGDSADVGGSFSNFWASGASRSNSENILASIACLSHPMFDFTPEPNSDVVKQSVTAALMVSGQELPTIMSLPTRSVPGLQVLTMASFGRNFPRGFSPKNRIDFGKVMHMGIEEKTKMLFDVNQFASHCFICGASGSGKSNTTYNLLEEFHKKGIPFLVIEPAKGEYKTEFAGMPNINVFTCRPDDYRTLSINPFQFDKAVHISAHIDRLQSVVQACWPMFGSLPSILRQAFEEVYIDCGWDLELSKRVIKREKEFPTFADMIPVAERIIDESGYSANSISEYKGALTMRIRKMMTGFEGRIFSQPKGIDDKVLFDGYTVVDLSDIGNAETRSIIMGILIIRLREYRYAHQNDNNVGLKHITVLEEAHNILKRCSHETSLDSANVQGASVGMLVDCIAEMRSVGEGMMIIDQSPGAVDEAAIKNTAIKIAMRLPEKNDCEAIGNALSLSPEQTLELSRLDVGVAAVFHVGWSETVLGRMGQIWKETEAAKQYRNPPKHVDGAQLLKAKGAVAQWVVARYVQDELSDLRDMTAVIDFLNDLRDNRVLESVNDNIWEDIKAPLFQLVTDYRERIQPFHEKGKVQGACEKVFGLFLRDFLQLDGMFRISPLKPPKKYDPRNIFKMMDVEDNRKAVFSWWEEMEQVVTQYMFMPVKADADPLRWDQSRMSNQYMKKAMEWILLSYAREYEQRSVKGMNHYRMAYYLLRTTRLKEG